MMSMLRMLAFVVSLACTVLVSGCALSLRALAPDAVVPALGSSGRVLALNSERRWAAVGTADGRLEVMRMSDGSEVAVWTAHSDSVNGLAWLPGGELLSGGYDGRLVRWDARGHRLQASAVVAPITAMAVDVVRDRVLTGHADGTIRWWSLHDLRPDAARPLFSGQVRAVAVNDRRPWAAASGSDGKVMLLRRRQPAHALTAPPRAIWSLAFSPDGRVLMGGGWFELARWDLVSGSMRLLPDAHHGIVKSIQFSPDGKTLATISRQTDSSVYLLDPSTGALRERLRAHSLCGAAIAYSADGRYLATTSDDATVQIWDRRRRHNVGSNGIERTSDK